MKLGTVLNERFAIRDTLDEIYKQLDLSFLNVRLATFSVDEKYRSQIIDDIREFISFQKIALAIEWLELRVSLNFDTSEIQMEIRFKAPLNVIPCEAVYKLQGK